MAVFRPGGPVREGTPATPGTPSPTVVEPS